MSSYSEGSIRAPKRGEQEHLTLDEEQFIKRYLSRPESFPQEFWRAIYQKMAVEGEPISASQVVGTKRAGIWQEYTPVWTSSLSPQPVLGNGTITGTYARVGDIIRATVLLTAGSTTTFGTSGWLFSLPVAAAGATRFLGNAAFEDISTGGSYIGFAISLSYAGPVYQFSSLYDVNTGFGVTPTTPFTWTNADIAAFFLDYRAEAS